MAQDDHNLIAFFLALPKPRRREYELLAERDRRFGEDVSAERRASGERERDETSRGRARGDS